MKLLCRLGLHDWEKLVTDRSINIAYRLKEDNKLFPLFMKSKAYAEIKYQSKLDRKVCISCSKVVDEIKEFEDFLLKTQKEFIDRHNFAQEVYFKNTTSPIVFPEFVKKESGEQDADI